jgi:hypothetical protein
MVEKVESGEYGSLKVNRIMPFLSEKHLNRLFKHFMKNMKDDPDQETNTGDDASPSEDASDEASSTEDTDES